MKKEYLIALVIGLFILSYVMDALVNSLPINLPTPYHYFTQEIFTTYAFTSATILMKTIGVVISILLVLSALGLHSFAKSGTLLILSGLMQLYSLQDIVTNSRTIPVEWAVTLTLSGMIFLIPTVIYAIKGLVGGSSQEVNIFPEEDTTDN